MSTVSFPVFLSKLEQSEKKLVLAKLFLKDKPNIAMDIVNIHFPLVQRFQIRGFFLKTLKEGI